MQKIFNAALFKKLWPIALGIVFCVVLALSADNATLFGPEEPPPAAPALPQPEATVKVYVSGAVGNPGIYDVVAGCRAHEAIAAAGGLRPEAAADKVNLVKLCKDGMHINVPFIKGTAAKAAARSAQKGNAGQGSQRQSGARPLAGSAQTVNYGDALNVVAPAATTNEPVLCIALSVATEAELLELPGVGAKTAVAIIAYRQSNGFKSVEDIMKVKGIGKAKFAKMRPYLKL